MGPRVLRQPAVIGLAVTLTACVLPPLPDTAAMGHDAAAEAGRDTTTDAAREATADGGDEAGTDASVDVACSELASLTDDFDDGVLGDAWGASWSQDGASYREEDGVIVFSFTGEQVADATLFTTRAYDLRGGHAQIELTAHTPAGAGHFWLKVLPPDADRGLALVVNRAELAAWTFDASGGKPVKATAYDPVRHRVLRLSEEDGNVRFETSADGASWALLHEMQAPHALDEVRVELRGGTWGPPGPGEVRIDRFNGGGPPDGRGTLVTCP